MNLYVVYNTVSRTHAIQVYFPNGFKHVRINTSRRGKHDHKSVPRGSVHTKLSRHYLHFFVVLSLKYYPYSVVNADSRRQVEMHFPVSHSIFGGHGYWLLMESPTLISQLNGVNSFMLSNQPETT